MFKHIVLTLAVLLALSCAKDVQPEYGVQSEAVTIQYGVGVDEPVKSLGDGKTANYVWYALYRADGSLVSACSTPVKIDVATGKAICPVTVAKDQNYKVVFLAMYFDNGQTMTPAYIINAQDKIVTMPSTTQANSDKFDFFYGTDEVRNFQSVQNGNVQLTRKVAQLNFELTETAWNTHPVTSDFQSAITISNVPMNFDLFTGAISGNGSTTFASSAIPFEAGSRRIGTAYCFATSTGDQKIDASIRLFDQSGTQVKTASASDAPVAANKQTNLIIY